MSVDNRDEIEKTLGEDTNEKVEDIQDMATDDLEGREGDTELEEKPGEEVQKPEKSQYSKEGIYDKLPLTLKQVDIFIIIMVIILVVVLKIAFSKR